VVIATDIVIVIVTVISDRDIDVVILLRESSCKTFIEQSEAFAISTNLKLHQLDDAGQAADLLRLWKICLHLMRGRR
jgi:hypothetical protein